MRHIPESFVTNVLRSSDLVIPISVDTICPHCKRTVNFSIKWAGNRSVVCEAPRCRCPACKQTVTFIFLKEKSSENDKFGGKLFIYPGLDIRKPLSGIVSESVLDEGLMNAYLSAINVANVREWTATAVLCRRVLEGIIKSVVPKNGRRVPLAQQLEELPKYINLSNPIISLAGVIKKGGNLGAHFDLEREPNEEIATLMLDFLDYLIEYIYILPKRIENLHQKIEDISSGQTID